jgi:hypothetical protein
MANNFLKNMKRNMKRRMKVKPAGMTGTGASKKFKIKGLGGLKFGKTKGY